MTVVVKDGIRYGRQGAVLTTTEFVELYVELIHLVLQCRDLVLHLLELGGILEGVATAVGRIDAFEAEVPTTVAWCLSIAFDLPPLALIASYGDVSVSFRPSVALTAIRIAFSFPLPGLRAGLG